MITGLVFLRDPERLMGTTFDAIDVVWASLFDKLLPKGKKKKKSSWYRGLSHSLGYVISAIMEENVRFWRGIFLIESECFLPWRKLRNLTKGEKPQFTNTEAPENKPKFATSFLFEIKNWWPIQVLFRIFPYKRLDTYLVWIYVWISRKELTGVSLDAQKTRTRSNNVPVIEGKMSDKKAYSKEYTH